MVAQTRYQAVAPGASPTRYANTLLPAPLVLLAARLLPLPVHGAIAGLPSICPFYRLTGYPCPTCGMTRSMVCCAHGQWREAAAFHPLGPAVFFACVVLSLLWLAGAARPDWQWSPSPRGRSILYWVGGACFIAVWIARLAGLLPPLV